MKCMIQCYGVKLAVFLGAATDKNRSAKAAKRNTVIMDVDSDSETSHDEDFVSRSQTRRHKQQQI